MDVKYIFIPSPIDVLHHSAAEIALKTIGETVPSKGFLNEITLFDPTQKVPSMDDPDHLVSSRHANANPTVRINFFPDSVRGRSIAMRSVRTPHELPGAGTSLAVTVSETPDYDNRETRGNSVLDIRLGVDGSLTAQQQDVLTGAGMLVDTSDRRGTPVTTVGIRTKDGLGLEGQIATAMNVLTPRIRTGAAPKPSLLGKPAVLKAVA